MHDLLLPVPVAAFERIEALVLDAVTSENTKRAYGRALREFAVWFSHSGHQMLTKAAVQQYRTELEARQLAPSTINLRLSAIRKLAAEAADNGFLDLQLAAGIGRVAGVRSHGVRAGNWLTLDQAERLCQLPELATLKGLRDRVVLVLCVGCGLRRAEVTQLTFEDIQQRDGRWAIVDLLGKGRRIRTIPLPNWAKPVIDAWAEAADLHTGRVLRAVDKSDRVHGTGLSAPSVFKIVRGYGIDLKVTISPHDLRRTFAKLAHKGRAPIEQIQLSLGHSSILTTERYLGVRQDLSDAPCDHIAIRL